MDGIEKAGGVDPIRLRPVSSTTPATPVAPATPQKPVTTSDVANLISLLAGSAPPIDTKKVEVIRSLIASGAYPIDEHAIAAKMLALDFPGRGEDADA
ncbi:flagellar biosynthesis anti-sigma factor FlgM [Sphingomonas sp. PR090111-T3T-6A]|uniref:flagellar biosynthesis anti-sigma factor FlgM n=1 Tax=Sphingomonas sp. PR090111-T3T-6A TaxID=685778 RepID=UPI0003601A06|nr:flagellar biosynthesis anti-sigma factor FlgM [Sphingomonas sp. PR090111-T3T-6A]